MNEPKVIELTEHDMDIVLLPVDAAYELKKGNSVTLSPPQPKLVRLSDLPDGTKIRYIGADKFERGNIIVDGRLAITVNAYGEMCELSYHVDEPLHLIPGEFQVWQGGPCPWPQYVEVEVVYRNGKRVIESATELSVDWCREKDVFDENDIIAHRCTGRLLEGAKLVY